MLLVFDCCHAGQLAGTRTREFSNRIFEFLGATQANDTTQAPGPESFTSALIWALKAFSKDVDGFTTSQLLAKILEAPNFPLDDGQRPCLTERGHHCLRRLRIAAVPGTESELDATPTKETEEPVEIKCFLNLSFMFTRCPTFDDISNLCHCLREVLQADSRNFPAQQVIWRGLFSKDTKRPEFSGVAEKVLYKLRQKSMSRSSNETSTSPKLAEVAFEGSEPAVSDSAGRIKLIHGHQIPQAESALSQLRGGYGLNGGFWTGPRSCILSLLTVFLLGCLAARLSLLLSAFIEP